MKKIFKAHKFILLPGLDGTGLLFEPFLKAFPNQQLLEVISYPPDGCLDYDQLAQVVQDKLPASEDIIIIAESFSGPVAARLVEHPRVAAIIFCASFLKTPRPFLLKLLALMPLSIIFRLSVPKCILKFACFSPNCHESIIRCFYKAIEKVDPDVLAHRLRMISNVDDLFTLKKNSIPICYIRASKDKLVPASCGESIYNSGAQVTLLDVEGPHFLLQSSPEQVIAAINSYCESLGGKDRRSK